MRSLCDQRDSVGSGKNQREHNESGGCFSVGAEKNLREHNESGEFFSRALWLLSRKIPHGTFLLFQVSLRICWAEVQREAQRLASHRALRGVASRRAASQTAETAAIGTILLLIHVVSRSVSHLDRHATTS
jgi:hypothetical protein